MLACFALKGKESQRNWVSQAVNKLLACHWSTQNESHSFHLSMLSAYRKARSQAGDSFHVRCVILVILLINSYSFYNFYDFYDFFFHFWCIHCYASTILYRLWIVRLILKREISPLSKLSSLTHSRALFDRTSHNKDELSFKRGDILYVTNTLFQGKLGVWKAWVINESDGQQKKEHGTIPSKTK